MLSIVCPFFNEKENLEELFIRLEKVAVSLGPAEIIWVDDASTDGSAETIKALARTSAISRLVQLPVNQGLSGALYAGFLAARGDVLATLDADLQNPPEEIPALLQQLEGFDVVTGIRRKRQDSLVKKASSKIANAIRRSVTHDHIQDTGCSLRVFRKETVKAFYPYHGMHRFFLPVAEAEGFKIKQIPVRHDPRLKGKAKYGLRNRIAGPLWDLIAVRWLLSKKIRLE